MSKSTATTTATTQPQETQESLFSRWLESIGAREASEMEVDASGYFKSDECERCLADDDSAVLYGMFRGNRDGKYEMTTCDGNLYVFALDGVDGMTDDEREMRTSIAHLKTYVMGGDVHVEMLAVHANHNSKGIGTALMREFLRRNPNGKVGPVTPGCMAILRKIWREDVASGEK